MSAAVGAAANPAAVAAVASLAVGVCMHDCCCERVSPMACWCADSVVCSCWSDDAWLRGDTAACKSSQQGAGVARCLVQNVRAETACMHSALCCEQFKSCWGIAYAPCAQSVAVLQNLIRSPAVYFLQLNKPSYSLLTTSQPYNNPKKRLLHLPQAAACSYISLQNSSSARTCWAFPAEAQAQRRGGWMLCWPE